MHTWGGGGEGGGRGGVGAKGWDGMARETELVRGEGEETISAIDMENSN